MSVDVTRFHALFFEESLEGLDALEDGLLRLDKGDHDPETLNAIFRAAHSIKGGAGTFGFKTIAEVTHALETLLDELRSERRQPTPELVTALLTSVDGLRAMLEAARNHEPEDAALIAQLHERFACLLAAPADAGAEHAPQAAAAPASSAAGWRIGFTPHSELFASGNDPLRIIQALAQLGRLQAEVDTRRLPPLDMLTPEDSYLAWTLTLHDDAAAVDEAAIREVFDWVEDECDLVIEPLPPPVRGGAADPREPLATDPAASPSGPAPGAPRARREAGEGGSSIRVAVDKVDALINLVGELVITQAMLKQLSGTLDPVACENLLSGLEQLEHNTRDLQEAVMSVRMLPMEFVFSRFPRVVRDVAGKLGKQVKLVTVGEGTELDKGVIERIADPLTHIVRNAVDHGIETPEQRRAAGKDDTGTLTLKAAHQGGHIVIEVSDDGRGLDRERILASAKKRGLALPDNPSDHEVYQLIFAPGLSTAAEVSDLSGRGVGMDVVRRNILELGGQVEVSSTPDQGTRVVIRLPLTLAILDGMSVKVGDEVYIIPLNFVVESLQPQQGDIRTMGGSQRVVRVRSDYLPLISLRDYFRAPAANDHSGLVVLVENDGQKLAVEVDELIGQQQVVIKNLENNYRRVRGVSGATIMGDGRVALILDVGGITRAHAQAA